MKRNRKIQLNAAAVLLSVSLTGTTVLAHEADWQKPSVMAEDSQLNRKVEKEKQSGEEITDRLSDFNTADGLGTINLRNLELTNENKDQLSVTDMIIAIILSDNRGSEFYIDTEKVAAGYPDSLQFKEAFSEIKPLICFEQTLECISLHTDYGAVSMIGGISEEQMEIHFFEENGSEIISGVFDLDDDFKSQISQKFLAGNSVPAGTKFTVGPLEYCVLENGTLAVKGTPDNKTTEITVPKSVAYDGKEYKVTRIGHPVSRTVKWESSFKMMTALKKIVVEPGVETADGYAFAGCPELETADVSGLKSISRGGFAQCPKLKEVKLSSDLENIGRELFYECGSLKEVTIPEGPDKIIYLAFADCTSLNKVVIPKSVKTIEKNCGLESCENLTIYGYKDTEAERYAKENNILFADLDGESFSSQYRLALNNNDEPEQSYTVDRGEILPFALILKKDGVKDPDFNSETRREGDIKIEVKDRNTAEVIDDGFLNGGYSIRIKGTKPGKTVITIKDVKSGARTDLEITVAPSDLPVPGRTVLKNFEIGRDNFSFLNSREDMTENNQVRPMDPVKFAKILRDQGYSAAEVTQMYEARNQEWGGFCFGLNKAVFMNYLDKFSPEDYGESSMYKLPKPVNHEDLQFILALYQLSCESNNVKSSRASFIENELKTEKCLKTLVSKLANIDVTDRPVWIDYHAIDEWEISPEDPKLTVCFGHSVLGYGIENNPDGFLIGGTVYQYKVLFNDPNFSMSSQSDENNNGAIYISSDFKEACLTGGKVNSDAENKKENIRKHSFKPVHDSKYVQGNDLFSISFVSDDYITLCTGRKPDLQGSAGLNSISIAGVNPGFFIDGIKYQKSETIRPLPADDPNNSQFSIPSIEHSYSLRNGTAEISDGQTLYLIESNGNLEFEITENGIKSINSDSPFEIKIVKNDGLTENPEVNSMIYAADSITNGSLLFKNSHIEIRTDNHSDAKVETGNTLLIESDEKRIDDSQNRIDVKPSVNDLTITTAEEDPKSDNNNNNNNKDPENNESGSDGETGSDSAAESDQNTADDDNIPSGNKQNGSEQSEADYEYRKRTLKKPVKGEITQTSLRTGTTALIGSMLLSLSALTFLFFRRKSK